MSPQSWFNFFKVLGFIGLGLSLVGGVGVWRANLKIKRIDDEKIDAIHTETKDGRVVQNQILSGVTQLKEEFLSQKIIEGDLQSDHRAEQPLNVKEIQELLAELETQRKLLVDSYNRALADNDFSRDLSVRLDFLIGTDDGFLFVLMDKLGMGWLCYDNPNREGDMIPFKDLIKRKDCKSVVDGVEVKYSTQDIIHGLATMEGGTGKSLKVNESFRKMIGFVTIGRHNIGCYTLLHMTPQVLESIDIMLSNAQRYYVEPMHLIDEAMSLLPKREFSLAMDKVLKAKAIMEEYRRPESWYMIEIEIRLSMIHFAEGDFDKSLEHSERALQLLGGRQWGGTSNIEPVCQKSVAVSLVRCVVPSQNEDAKQSYRRSVGLLNSSIDLIMKPGVYRDNGFLEGAYEYLSVAHLFLGDFVSALSDADNALSRSACEKHHYLKGISLLGLKRYSEANEIFESQRKFNAILCDSLIAYSNSLASGQEVISVPYVWNMLYGDRPWI